MGKPKVTYFTGRGRAEIIRIILVASGVEFENVFLGKFNPKQQPEDFTKLVTSGALLYGSVPAYEDDDIFLVQTGAIVRYLSKKYKLYGSNDIEAALVDQYFEGFNDFFLKMFPVLFSPPEEKEKKKEEARTTVLPVWFERFEKIIKKSKGTYVVGDKLSLADLYFFLVFEFLFDEVDEKKYPNLFSYLTNLFKIKVLSDYASDKK